MEEYKTNRAVYKIKQLDCFSDIKFNIIYIMRIIIYLWV